MSAPSATIAGIPRHVAIIMDGNGRWAARRRRPRMIGHRAGARAVNLCIDFCLERGVAALTLFSFSSENWGRPADEVGALAASVPDNGGVYLVPAFTGLGSPWWDPDARGTLVGITRGTTRGHIARAVVEAMAYQVRDEQETHDL